jgi:hypothetical protein
MSKGTAFSETCEKEQLAIRSVWKSGVFGNVGGRKSFLYNKGEKQRVFKHEQEQPALYHGSRNSMSSITGGRKACSQTWIEQRFLKHEWKNSLISNMGGRIVCVQLQNSLLSNIG